jgi:cytochrome c oxidase subunit 2
MNVDLYERIWMWAAAAIIALFLALVGVTTFAQGIRPPSHAETIDPAQVMADPRFATPGVTTNPDGSVTVSMVAGVFFWLPNEVRVPAGRKVTFRITAMDVTHGFQIAGTNVNTMVLPGYVSQLSTTFEQPGEYLVLCNEYCGIGHHTMSAKVIVEAAP